MTDVPGLSTTLSVLRDDIDDNSRDISGCRGEINSLGQEVAVIGSKFSQYVMLSSVDQFKAPLTQSNLLVTQKHLEMFDNVMTFKGVVSADPNTYLSGEALSDGYKLGDVVFLDISSTEWLLTGERGQGYLNWKWEEIGDQDHHVTKAEFQAFKASAEVSVADLSSQAGDLSAWVQRLSDETSSFSNDWKT